MARSVVLRVFPPVSYVLCDSQGSVKLGDTEPVLLRAKRLAKYAFAIYHVLPFAFALRNYHISYAHFLTFPQSTS